MNSHGNGQQATGNGNVAVRLSGVIVTETDRLILRRVTLADAPFILELLNDPDWLRYIGDKGVRNLDDARKYIENGPMAMYARYGFGLFIAQLKDGTPIGMCGLLKRDTLEHADIGFAFLPAYRAKGFAGEAAAAALAWGKEECGLDKVVAITSLDNHASGRLLERLGLRFERTIQFSGEELKLFST